ncbi:MAG: glycosyltransferase family 39 protein, partial [Nitrosopumilus sp.]|nr:glycosyltransferase family 39 protein [Nitrosopumilus sp.]
MKNKNLPFFILTASVFVFLVLPSLFKEGLFMDGLIYAAISKNLANGLGSFWSPYFTATFLPSFHEHPPLAFGLQSIFFDVLGDAFYVEKIYSLFTAIIQGVIIIAIWRSFSGEKYKETFWLPIFLWITIPLCFWTYSNNMLENTMAMFTTSAILMQLLAFKRSQPHYLLFIISAVLIFLAFLSKGLPGLFPLAFPFIHWIVLKKLSFSKYLKSFLFLIVT